MQGPSARRGGKAVAGTRYSHQREMIYHAVRGRRDHPTAEMVFGALKPENPSLSLGTVYRNLNLLVKGGRLVRMPFPVERYDGETCAHSHFCCEKCGCVEDVELPYDRELDASASRMLGYQIMQHSVVFYGLCPNCGSEKPL